MREITNVSNVTDAFGAVVYSNEVSTLIVQNAISLEYIRSEFCCDRPCRSRCDPSPCCFWVSCLAVLCGELRVQPPLSLRLREPVRLAVSGRF